MNGRFERQRHSSEFASELARDHFPPADVEEIIDLRWTILREGLPRETACFDGDADPTTHHFAASLGNEVIACASFMRNSFENEPAWQLRGMAVSPDYQSRGIGARLLTFAEKIIGQEEHSSLLWCHARCPAERFYQREGWKTVSEPFEIPNAPLHVKMIKRIVTSVR